MPEKGGEESNLKKCIKKFENYDVIQLGWQLPIYLTGERKGEGEVHRVVRKNSK